MNSDYRQQVKPVVIPYLSAKAACLTCAKCAEVLCIKQQLPTVATVVRPRSTVYSFLRYDSSDQARAIFAMTKERNTPKGGCEFRVCASSA